MQPKSNVKPQEFSNAIKRAQHRDYISKKTKDALRERDAHRFLRLPATKKQFIKTFKDLQEESLIPKAKPAQNYYHDIERDRLRTQTAASKVKIGANFLKGRKMFGHFFLSHVANLDPKAAPRLKSLMQEWGLTPRQALKDTQMKRLLQKLREEGAISVNNLGQEILEKERLRIAWMKMEREREDTETGYYGSSEDTRFNAKSGNKLPSHIKYHTGTAAASSISHVNEQAEGGLGPVTSVRHADNKNTDRDKTDKSAKKKATTSIYRQDVAGADDDESFHSPNLPDMLV